MSAERPTWDELCPAPPGVHVPGEVKAAASRKPGPLPGPADPAWTCSGCGKRVSQSPGLAQFRRQRGTVGWDHLYCQTGRGPGGSGSLSRSEQRAAVRHAIQTGQVLA